MQAALLQGPITPLPDEPQMKPLAAISIRPSLSEPTARGVDREPEGARPSLAAAPPTARRDAIRRVVLATG